MSFLEPSAHVPLLVWSPSRFGPRRVKEPVSLADILPTFAAIAGAPALARPVDGRSLLPLLEGADVAVPSTLEQAREAAGLVEIDYSALPSVVDGRQALAEGAPRLWEQAPRNTAFHIQKGDAAAVAAAMKQAAHGFYKTPQDRQSWLDDVKALIDRMADAITAYGKRGRRFARADGEAGGEN